MEWLNNWDKVEVTTDCPTCGRPWTRTRYVGELINGIVLEMCDDCVRANSDEHGNLLVTLVTKWGDDDNGKV